MSAAISRHSFASCSYRARVSGSAESFAIRALISLVQIPSFARHPVRLRLPPFRGLFKIEQGGQIELDLDDFGTAAGHALERAKMWSGSGAGSIRTVPWECRTANTADDTAPLDWLNRIRTVAQYYPASSYRDGFRKHIHLRATQLARQQKSETVSSAALSPCNRPRLKDALRSYVTCRSSQNAAAEGGISAADNCGTGAGGRVLSDAQGTPDRDDCSGTYRRAILDCCC
jgi:hypothetical protein